MMTNAKRYAANNQGYLADVGGGIEWSANLDADEGFWDALALDGWAVDADVVKPTGEHHVVSDANGFEHRHPVYTAPTLPL